MAFGRAWASLRLLGAIAALLSTGGAEPHALIAFETQGRDAWTWRKEIALSVADAACDEVIISSPAASLVRRPQSGHVVASMPLVAGDNSVSAECWKAGVRRGETVRQHWVVRLRDAPTAHLRVVVRDDGVTLDASASETARSRPTPITRYSWRAGERNPGPLAMPAEGMTVALPAPFVDGEYHVSLTIADATGRTDKATVMLRVHEGKVRRLDGPDAAGWIGNAVIYGVMLSAFEPPRLPAVTARLDALKRLGVNTVWLSPITRSAPGDFGYAVTGHFALRADLGSEADLRALVEAAHLRDMRVILDFVPNHLSDHHPYYLSASRLGSASPYYDFFARTPSGEATHYFNWSNLKNLNYGNPEVRQMMIEAFAYWVRAFDIDGFRVDAAWGPRERTPGFWPRLQQELRRIKPDLLLLAEASARDAYYGRNGFDAAYDWTDRLGVWSWANAFGEKEHIARRLREALASGSGPGGIRIFRFLNNNDTGARFVTRHGVGLTRVASAMLLTLPGIPGLYTGDEIGAEFEPYGQRRAISWDDAHGLRPWYSALLRLRRNLPALRSRELRLLDLPGAGQVLAYLRPGKDKPGGGILVFLNFGSRPVEVKIPESALAELPPRPTLEDLLDGSEMDEREAATVRLPGYGVRILKAQ